MTVQEVIEFLKGGCLMLACEYHLQNRCNNDYEGREKKKEEALKIAIKCMEEVEQYRALGTAEELKEAREKQVPEKPIKDLQAYSGKICPACEDEIGLQQGQTYCAECGQKIDWSEEDE